MIHQQNDYGIWGYFIILFPAFVFLFGLLLGYYILDFIIKKVFKNDLKKQILSYCILAFILTILSLLTFYKGTFTETVYLAIPSIIVGILVVLKLKAISRYRIISYIWIVLFTVLGLLALITIF
jgi:hypothetical protein